MPAKPPDFLNNDILRDYQSLAQQSWDAWSRQWQQPSATPSFFKAPPAKSAVEETVERSLDSFKGYLDWLQRAASSGAAQPARGADWWQSLQPLFGAVGQPFMQPFAGIESASAHGFAQQWQSWLQATQSGASNDWRQTLQTPAFGSSREQQEQQQALLLAMFEHQQASQRYQGLMLRAQLQGAERLQRKLVERSESAQKVESLKALYDLWVDAAEEAYAEIALSNEFREAYAAQVNTQMRVRQLQQLSVEQWCREVGLPTRSEVSSLGQRLHELRREMRQVNRRMPDEELAAVRAELDALKRQLQERETVRPDPKMAAKTSVGKADGPQSAIAKKNVAKDTPAASVAAKEASSATAPKGNSGSARGSSHASPKRR